MTVFRTVLFAAASLLAVGLWTPAHAATIVALGFENTTGGNWRTTTPSKSASYDPNGDNAYGSDGYYLGLSEIDTTVSSSTPPELTSGAASYISNVNAFGGFYSGGGYIDIDDPTQPIGSSVSDLQSGIFTQGTSVMSFTVSATTRFILTVIMGGQQGTNAPPDTLTLAQTGGSGSGTASISGMGTTVGTYAFFDVDAAAGDTFNIDTVNGANQGITGFAVEQIPGPGAALLCVLGVLLLVLRRRRCA